MADFDSEKIIVSIVAVSLILIALASVFPSLGIPTTLPFLLLAILISVIAVLSIVTGKLSIKEKSSIFVFIVALAVAGALVFYAPSFLGSVWQPAVHDLQSIIGVVP